jgi:hypothetical protein
MNLTCKLKNKVTIAAKICNKESTRTKTNWTIGGVTYRRTIPQNSFANGALSKEIKNEAKLARKPVLSIVGIFMVEDEVEGWR